MKTNDYQHRSYSYCSAVPWRSDISYIAILLREEFRGRYLTTERPLLNYLIWSSKGSDILLFDLRIGFIENFHFFLKADKGLSINSSGKHIKNLKKPIRDCVDKDWLDRDPFWRYKVKHTDPKVPRLSAEQLKLMEEKEISIKRLELVRDIFVFSCYTGFAYVDLANFTSDHVQIGVDGNKWLSNLGRKPEYVNLFQYCILQCVNYRNTRIIKTVKEGRCYSSSF